jgi:hypothetical protein
MPESRTGSAAPKDTGLGRLPSDEFAINQAWCTAAALACDLIAWLQILALDGDLAAAEPKRLRYRMLHTAARLVRGQRRRWLRIPLHLALGRPDHHSVHPDRGHPRTRLTSSVPTRRPKDPGDHAHRRDRRLLTMPTRHQHRQLSTDTAGQARQTRITNDRGLT